MSMASVQHEGSLPMKNAFGHGWRSMQLARLSGGSDRAKSHREPESASVSARVSAPRLYKETFGVVVLSGLLIYLLDKSAFDGFFFGEDFNWYAQYLATGGNFLRALFAPFAIFFRPGTALWGIGSQLLLPWDPLVHHVFNFLLTLVNVVLLHRIMLRVTSSRSARILGIAFFAISKAHLSTIGMIAGLDLVVTLLHFLATLLFLLRYLQGRKRVDLILSLVFFTLGIFSRDYSIAFLSVVFVLFFFFTLETKDKPGGWKAAAVKFLPFTVIAVGYLIIRIAIVGLPYVGGGWNYGISFDTDHFVKASASQAGVLLNLSMFDDQTYLTGYGDLSTMLTADLPTIQAYRTDLFFLGSVLLLLTSINGIWYRKWTVFGLVWAVAMIAPTFLVGNPHVYYMTESVAATALLLAMALDSKVPGRKILLGLWIPALLILGLNGYANSQNIGVLWWRGSADQASNIDRQILKPNRGSPIRSLTVIASEDDEGRTTRALADFLYSGAMLRTLLSLDHNVKLQFLDSQQVFTIDQVTPSGTDLVYLQQGSTYSQILTYDYPRIEVLYPERSFVGVRFNEQRNGKAAIGIDGKGFEPSSVIYLNDEPAATFYANSGLITAFVPDKFFESPGRIKVSVISRRLLKSNTLTLAIEPR